MIGITLPNFRSEVTGLVDGYNAITETKNNKVATIIANHRRNKERASAPLIGAAIGGAEGVIFSASYALSKAFPILQKFPITKWAVNKIDSWVAAAQKVNPNKSALSHFFTGAAIKTGWLMLSGAAIGVATDIYKMISNTKINGKISKTKQGGLGDCWLLSGLNSLSYTEEGRKIIKDSIKLNKDKSVTVSLKGVNKEYTITRDELKKASKSYIADIDENGTVVDYMKRYSKGDGDTLAFELAFEKYRQDLKDGKIEENPNVPAYAYDILPNPKEPIEAGVGNQVYYLLSGKKCGEITMTKSLNAGIVPNLDIMNMYSKTQLDKLLTNIANNPEQYAASFNVKEKTVVDTTSSRKTKLVPNHVYAIKSVTPKGIQFVDPHNAKRVIEIPLHTFRENANALWFVNLKDDTNNSEAGLRKNAEISSKNSKKANEIF